MKKLKVYDSGEITATGASESFNTDFIKGEIVKIQIDCSASTDFKILCDASDVGTTSIVDEYILGASGSAVTVNTSLVIYPVVPQYLAAGTITDPDQFCRYVVDEELQVLITNLTADDTYRVVIWYEEFE
jgi:hypothetical protein